MGGVEGIFGGDMLMLEEDCQGCVGWRTEAGER